MTTFLAMLARPFIAFVVLAFICLPARLAIIKWFPNGRLKNILLFDLKASRARITQQTRLTRAKTGIIWHHRGFAVGAWLRRRWPKL